MRVTYNSLETFVTVVLFSLVETVRGVKFSTFGKEVLLDRTGTVVVPVIKAVKGTVVLLIFVAVWQSGSEEHFPWLAREPPSIISSAFEAAPGSEFLLLRF